LLASKGILSCLLAKPNANALSCPTGKALWGFFLPARYFLKILQPPLVLGISLFSELSCLSQGVALLDQEKGILLKCSYEELRN